MWLVFSFNQRLLKKLDCDKNLILGKHNHFLGKKNIFRSFGDIFPSSNARYQLFVEKNCARENARDSHGMKKFHHIYSTFIF